jgi:hypothetical protein
MTQLSPDAKAVLDAAVVVSWDWSNQEPASSSVVAAATLRAAADQTINVQRSVEMWELHQKFHAIATELEAL